MTSRFLIILITLLTFSSCSRDGFEKVPEEKFIGTWELQGRPLFDGIKIEISKSADNKLTGRIIELNDNKYVKMFTDSNDIWINEIRRKSNYQFGLTEIIIAKDLFSLYGINSSMDFKVEFIDENTIGLSKENSDPKKSDIIYKRIK